MILRHLCKSPSGAPPLRVGLLLDGPILSQFFAEIVDHIQQSNFARIELLIYNDEALSESERPTSPRPLWRKLYSALFDRNRRKRLLYDAYARLDARFAQITDDPDAEVDCTKRFASIRSIRVRPQTKRFVHRFSDDDVCAVEAENLDVMIRMGFNILRGRILSAARCGVWSYHHGDNEYYRGGPAYFWEMLEGNPMCGAILQVLTEELDAGHLLCAGRFTSEEGYSHLRFRRGPYWGSLYFMIQKLRELHIDGWDAVRSRGPESPPYKGLRKIYTAPTNGDMIRWLVPLFARKLVRRLTQRETVKHWKLAIRSDVQALSGQSSVVEAPNLEGFAWADSPFGHFYADPFVVEHLGETWVFFEDFDYHRDIGDISVARVEGNGLSDVKPVLRLPHHLSYPFVFCDSGQWYMIPESVAAEKVSLYRCIDFPLVWQHDCDLLDGPWVDTTLWIDGGQYWMFTTYQEPRGDAYQLWLFHAHSLRGPWIPHPQNPLSQDVRHARSAGRLFRAGDALIRPSQDCGGEYGRSILFHRVEKLSVHDYAETEVGSIDPKLLPPLVGIHTYGRTEQFEVIDGKWTLPASSVL